MTFNVFSGIECREDTLGGKPIIAGTRIPVWQILQCLLWGETPSDIVHTYDTVTPHDVTNAINFALLVLRGGMKHPNLRLTQDEREKLVELLESANTTVTGNAYPGYGDGNGNDKVLISRFLNYFDKPD